MKTYWDHCSDAISSGQDMAISHLREVIPVVITKCLGLVIMVVYGTIMRLLICIFNNPHLSHQSFLSFSFTLGLQEYTKCTILIVSWNLSYNIFLICCPCSGGMSWRCNCFWLANIPVCNPSPMLLIIPAINLWIHYAELKLNHFFSLLVVYLDWIDISSCLSRKSNVADTDVSQNLSGNHSTTNVDASSGNATQQW